MTRLARLALLLPLLLAPVAAAAQPAPLERTQAFEHGYAVSFYQFDGCGDALAGRLFRRALAERVAQCPFSATAKADYARRTGLEFAKARKLIADLIEQENGLPRSLPGMTETCHAHQASAEYRAFRDRLEAYGAGVLKARDLLPAPCDAEDVLP